MKKTLIINLAVAGLTLSLVFVLQRSGWIRIGILSSEPVVVEAKAIAPAGDDTKPAQRTSQNLVTKLQTIADSDARSQALEEALAGMSESDRQELLAQLSGDNSEAAEDLRESLVRRWAESNPAAAAAWISQLPPSEYRAALKQVAIAWADKDLAGASAWLSTLPAAARQFATLDVAYEAAATDPLTALKLAGGLPASAERDDLLAFAVSQWAAADATKAAAWAQRIPNATLRQELLATVSVAMAPKNGAAAAALVGTALPTGSTQDRIAVSIVQRWAQTSPQATANWVSQFPEAPVRYAAVQNLMAVWTPKNPTAAGDWLNSLPAGKTRTLGTIAYTNALASLNSSYDEALP